MRMRVSPHASINVAVPYHAIFMTAIFSYFNRYGSKSQSECQAIGIKKAARRASARRAAQNFCFLTVKLGDDRRIPIGSDIGNKVKITPVQVKPALKRNGHRKICKRTIRTDLFCK